jgi:hypothetical protein
MEAWQLVSSSCVCCSPEAANFIFTAVGAACLYKRRHLYACRDVCSRATPTARLPAEESRVAAVAGLRALHLQHCRCGAGRCANPDAAEAAVNAATPRSSFMHKACLTKQVARHLAHLTVGTGCCSSAFPQWQAAQVDNYGSAAAFVSRSALCCCFVNSHFWVRSFPAGAITAASVYNTSFSFNLHAMVPRLVWPYCSALLWPGCYRA